MRLLIIGAGNMGGAIARGLLDAGALAPAELGLVDPSPDTLAPLASRGCATFTGAPEALRSLAPDTALLLAVKPQMFGALAQEIAPTSCGRLVASIMAGVNTARLASALPGARLVRTMPNLGVTINAGLTAIADSDEPDLATVEAWFRTVGATLRLPEDQLDAFTAVAGSGPAYVFLLAEAMIEGATRAGIGASDARAMVERTISAAAGLLTSSDLSPEQWRARVTSKGGTTQAAIEVMQTCHVPEAIASAILAARDRARELSRA
ncbi:MAG: pyrroline-5-carboxylate reductase [Planctomycetota bacterium]|nr:pyrroline-5-carboxylate reductase [Planctomycetota bacterium]